MNVLKNKLNLKYNPSVYISRELAFNSLQHSVKPHIVMLGDHPEFWVVCPSDAERLYKAGYEFAH